MVCARYEAPHEEQGPSDFGPGVPTHPPRDRPSVENSPKAGLPIAHNIDSAAAAGYGSSCSSASGTSSGHRIMAPTPPPPRERGALPPRAEPIGASGRERGGGADKPAASCELRGAQGAMGARSPQHGTP